jgi:hypothetical protein
MPDSTGKRDRSPAFPQVSLGEAVDRLVAFEKHFTRHPAPLDKAGAAWGLKQCGDILAALRYFGFLEYAGAVDARQVVITDEGRNLLRTQQESTKRDIIQRAALRPKEIAKFWPIWGSDRPPDDVCLDELTLRNGFSPRGAPLFLASYDATISFAGLSTADKIAADSPVETNAGDGARVAANEAKPAANPPSPFVKPPARQREVAIMEGERIVFTEEGQPNQYLKLIASGPIDDGLLEALEDFVKRQRRRVNSALHRDRERWQAELAACEEAGLGNSKIAETIRSWIQEADQIVDAL